MEGDHAKKTKKQANSPKRRIVDASDVLPTVVTGSFWAADLIFYGISASFFVSYILLSRYLNKVS